jgi:hypothetical protein
MPSRWRCGDGRSILAGSCTTPTADRTTRALSAEPLREDHPVDGVPRRRLRQRPRRVVMSTLKPVDRPAFLADPPTTPDAIYDYIEGWYNRAAATRRSATSAPPSSRPSATEEQGRRPSQSVRPRRSDPNSTSSLLKRSDPGDANRRCTYAPLATNLADTLGRCSRNGLGPYCAVSDWRRICGLGPRPLAQFWRSA